MKSTSQLIKKINEEMSFWNEMTTYYAVYIIYNIIFSDVRSQSMTMLSLRDPFRCIRKFLLYVYKHDTGQVLIKVQH